MPVTGSPMNGDYNNPMLSPTTSQNPSEDITSMYRRMKPEGCNNGVSDLRRILPMFVAEVYHNDEKRLGKRKMKNLWESRPTDWPMNIPFIDPNNGYKDSEGKSIKPKKPELVAMYDFIRPKYQESHPNLEINSGTIPESGYYDPVEVQKIINECANATTQIEITEDVLRTLLNDGHVYTNEEIQHCVSTFNGIDFKNIKLEEVKNTVIDDDYCEVIEEESVMPPPPQQPQQQQRIFYNENFNSEFQPRSSNMGTMAVHDENRRQAVDSFDDGVYKLPIYMAKPENVDNPEKDFQKNLKVASNCPSNFDLTKILQAYNVDGKMDTFDDDNVNWQEQIPKIDKACEEKEQQLMFMQSIQQSNSSSGIDYQFSASNFNNSVNIKAEKNFDFQPPQTNSQFVGFKMEISNPLEDQLHNMVLQSDTHQHSVIPDFNLLMETDDD